MAEFKFTRETQTVQGDPVWQAVKNSWAEGVTVSNERPVTGPAANVLIAPCPLYKPGGFAESQLLVPSQPVRDIDQATQLIRESRVANKLKAYEAVLASFAGQLARQGKQLNLSVVFANAGVLTKGTPSPADAEALAIHGEAYLIWFKDFCSQQGISFSFTSFAELGISLNQFVDPNTQVTGLDALSAEQYNEESPRRSTISC